VPSLLAPVSYPAGDTSLTACDLNNDGIADLATVYLSDPTDVTRSVAVLLGKGDGTFAAAKTMNIGYLDPRDVVAGDINGDGKLDLVTLDTNSLSVFLGNGDGTLRAPLNLSLPKDQSIGPMALGDFNGDGKSDVVVAGYISSGGGYPHGHFKNTYYVNVLLGSADGSLVAKSTNEVSEFYTVAAGEFNGDHKLDVLAGGSCLLLGKGDGTLQKPALVSDTVSGRPVVGDFNGDGKFDFVTYDSTVGNVFINNGNGSFRLLGTIKLNRGLEDAVAAGDFNGDGKLDLAVANSSSGSVSVQLGNGDGTFQAARSFAAGPEMSDLAVADFNRDGWLDLALTNSNHDSVSVLLNDGHW
jgi:hypothetical protein